MLVTIEVEQSALNEARTIFKDNKEFCKMLDRFELAYARHDRTCICRIANTGGAWQRYKDYLTNTRVAFVVEKDNGVHVLVVKHVLPRTNDTYEIFKFLFESARNA